jgi:ABC-type sugar transport systems, permease components
MIIKENTPKVRVKNKKKLASLFLFTAPALIFYTIFLVIPMIGGIVYSFTDWNGLNLNLSFVGLSNFVEALKEDKDFVNSIWFTFKYSIIIIIIENLGALFLAVIIESKNKGKGFFRTIFFMPNMISMIIGSFIWTFIFTKVLVQIAAQTPFKFLDQSWIGDPNFSFFSIIIVSVWAGTGYLMLIYLAALQGVPPELKEAALIDGATKVQNFFKVTLPMIMHAITICVFLTLNTGFKVFDTVYALTGGGPGKMTQVMTLNIYQEAFSSNFRFGYACAKSMIMFLIILIITLVQLGVMKKKEVEA